MASRGIGAEYPLLPAIDRDSRVAVGAPVLEDQRARPGRAAGSAGRARPPPRAPGPEHPVERRQRRAGPLGVGRIDEGQVEGARRQRAGGRRRPGAGPPSTLRREAAGLRVPGDDLDGARATTPRRSRRRSPRESASRASAPVPAYRSSTRRPSKNWPSTLKTAPRTLSLVGRVPSPAGAASRRPRAVPATMRTGSAPRRVGSAARSPARARGRGRRRRGGRSGPTRSGWWCGRCRTAPAAGPSRRRGWRRSGPGPPPPPPRGPRGRGGRSRWSRRAGRGPRARPRPRPWRRRPPRWRGGAAPPP